MQERLVRGGFDRRAHQDPAEVRKAVLGARLEPQRVIEMLQRVDRPIARSPNSGPSSPPSLLTPAMCPITWRSVTATAALELRHVGLDLLVELQPLFLQQQSDRGRRERRGGGADPEPRFRRHRHFASR